MSKATTIIGDGKITSITIPAGCPARLNPRLRELNSHTYRDEYSNLTVDDEEIDYFVCYDYDGYVEETISKDTWLKLPIRPAEYRNLKNEISDAEWNERKAGIKHVIGSGQGYSESPHVIIGESKND